MRARIIFRGLTLFKFARTSADSKDSFGQLEAWLVSDPRHAHMPLHRHTPTLGFIGRDVGQPVGNGRVQQKTPLRADCTIALQGHRIDSGVTVDGSFLDYVPDLSALYGQKWGGDENRNFITRKISIPSGRIRAGEFIMWDWHGKTPAKVGFMDTTFQGYAANEVIVDIGDDSDCEADNDDQFLMITEGEKTHTRLWAYTKGGRYEDDIEPNTVDVLIDNHPARRRRPVFWGLHFQLLFEAAQFTRRTAYRDVAQYENFVKAALAYDDYEWNNDVRMMGIGNPFPYLINPRVDEIDGLAAATHPDELQSPPPLLSWRQKGECEPKDSAAGMPMPPMGGTSMPMDPGTPGCDPANSNICGPAFIGP
jgi:hypothetical protein